MNRDVEKMAFSHCNGGAVQNFSDRTTMHGFSELYNAKSFIWKFIWLVAIVGATGMTGYQIYKLLELVFDGVTSTVIQPLSSDPIYPPIQICYVHWAYWVDWNRAVNLGLDKPSAFYGLSFLANVISEMAFNTTEAELKFKATMAKNGFLNIFDLYVAMSYPAPPGITKATPNWQKWERSIHLSHGMFCYVASHEMIFSGLKDRTLRNRIELFYDKNFFTLNESYITATEYSTYIQKFIENTIPTSKLREGFPYLNFANSTTTPFIYVDNKQGNMISIAEDSFWTTITLTVNVYNWMTSRKLQCNSDKSQTSVYEICEEFCRFKSIKQQNPTQLLQLRAAFMLENTSMENVCQMRIVFLNGTMTDDTCPPPCELSGQFYDNCFSAYCKVPCQEWRHSITVYTMPMQQVLNHFYYPNRITIDYPQKELIIEMNEVPAHDWEAIVGNLGGTVGLWLGGSILSILQMIYLLCCGYCDEKMKPFNTNSNKYLIKPVKIALVNKP